MKKKQRGIQFALISIGLLLFALTYFYYPSIKKDKILKDQSVNKDSQKVEDMDQSSSFEKLQYKGKNKNTPFIVKSNEAYILNDEPNIVWMKDMNVVLYLSDMRIVRIKSLKGRYNKQNFNMYFEREVVATDGETVITAENLDLLATENIMKVYNDVNLDDATGSLQADSILYDLEKKYITVNNFDDKAIKMKVIQ